MVAPCLHVGDDGRPFTTPAWADRLRFVPVGHVGNKTGRPEFLVTQAVWMHGVLIPAGFRTDGGTVPDWAHWVARPLGKGLPAFIVHDYRYTIEQGSRLGADREMLRNLRADGFSWPRRRIVYYAVRVGGEEHWSNDADT